MYSNRTNEELKPWIRGFVSVPYLSYIERFNNITLVYRELSPSRAAEAILEKKEIAINSIPRCFGNFPQVIQAAHLIHEYRHIEGGYPHVDRLYDLDFESGGARAVEAEFLARVASKGSGVDPLSRLLARFQLQTVARLFKGQPEGAPSLKSMQDALKVLDTDEYFSELKTKSDWRPLFDEVYKELSLDSELVGLNLRAARVLKEEFTKRFGDRELKEWLAEYSKLKGRELLFEDR